MDQSDFFGATAPQPAPFAPRNTGIGGHQSAAALTTTWLTPRFILDALGDFDFDPCAAPAPRPWATAARMNSELDGDGLAMEWDGRVWLNPPYTSTEIEDWLRKLAEHGRGTSLIFARTETAAFRRQVWDRASGLLFLTGRLHFHRLDAPRPHLCNANDNEHAWVEYAPKSFACAHCGKAKANAGAPSVLCAYGQDDMDRLAACDLEGAFVPLRFARFVMLASAPDESWAQIIRQWIGTQRGPVSVSDAYRHFARHPKASRNRHWRAKVRQKLQVVALRVDRDSYVAAA